ncbi:MAG: M14 family metallocarboxypeptidase [Gemmatimonadetes bacterium]|jgi:murein peptide amidase A|nr:M14 family metallocarboxypeptidase [Gemmatimonadota bacterium]MBT6145655.1 M14 family metallocarboxypeptidase [Gemmatimonadota bacterium]MBT7863604.1 M14 family metallocarboxypeptidase [Gemmatimonadota bacterium]
MPAPDESLNESLDESRNIDDLMHRLEVAAARPELLVHEARLQVLGEVSHGEAPPVPLMHLSLGRFQQRRVLVIAGTHGDEPASVEAMLQLLEQFPEHYLDAASVDILPCTNPTGWCLNTRENAAGIDVNWAFDRHDVPEVTILRHFLQGRRWEVIVDFHEDWEATGFYLYEHRRGADYIGPQVVDQVADVCPLSEAVEIDGWPADHAVIHADDSVERLRRGDGLPLILLRDHTDHKVTTETPTCLPLQQRVDAHHQALAAILAHHLGTPG